MQEYIENVLDSSVFDIYFLTWRTDLNEKVWKDKNVRVFTLINDNESKIKNIFKLVFRFLRIRYILRKLDIIHYHFIDHRFTLLTDFFIGRNAKNTILTFWGSDLLRQSKKTVLSFSKIYKRAAKINVMNEEMLDKFQEVTDCNYSDKLLSLDFGDSTLDAVLSAVKQGGSVAKSKWQIPTDKVTVHLGYNGFIAQQHLNMINSLKSCSESVKKSVFVIVPLSYGCPNEEYKKQIIDVLKNAGISFYVLDEFIAKEDVGIFRLTADIFLYGQTTDAVSASMIEYLAAGTTVIKPRWLVYSELTDNGVSMIEYKDFDALTEVFEEVILNKLYEKTDAEKNRSVVLALKSWQALKDKWLEMYNN